MKNKLLLLAYIISGLLLTNCMGNNPSSSNNSIPTITAKSIDTPPQYQNPFMAPNDLSEIHNNSYQDDTTSIQGPAYLKSSVLQETETSLPTGPAATIAFNSLGQIITIRSVISSESTVVNNLMLIDPVTLKTITSTNLPSRANSLSDVSFSGGGYFYLDNLDRVVCVTTTKQIRIYELQNNQFVLDTTYDLSTILSDPNDMLNSVLPDSNGNLWFTSKLAIVGYVNPNNANIYSTNIPANIQGANSNETITKSLATDNNGGVYIVTDYALYRFQIDNSNSPIVTWRTAYDRGVRIKPGQIQQGSGTTPSLFDDAKGNKFVTIADNADPAMHVLIFNRDTGALLASQEVFTSYPNLNSCENSLIAVNDSVLIENNYGNTSAASLVGLTTTKPGLAKVDYDPDTGKSSVIWENMDISIPSVVSTLSKKDGVVYTYAKDAEGWYFAAVDYWSGSLVTTKRVFVTNPLYDNWYSGLNIGPDGTAYVGVLGGFVAWHPL